MKLRWILAAIAWSSVLLFGFVPANGADAPCDAASVVAEVGQPARAMGMIAQYRAEIADPDACADELTAAGEQVAEAEEKLADAQASLDQEVWSKAKEGAEDASLLDRRLDSRAQAIIDKADDEIEETAPERAKGEWDTVKERYVDPAGDVLVPALGVIVGILVVARALLLVRWPLWTGPPPLLIGGALVLSVIGAMVVVTRPDDLAGDRALALWELLAVLGGLSSWALANLMPSRQSKKSARVIQQRDAPAVAWAVSIVVLALIAAAAGLVASVVGNTEIVMSTVVGGFVLVVAIGVGAAVVRTWFYPVLASRWTRTPAAAVGVTTGVLAAWFLVADAGTIDDRAIVGCSMALLSAASLAYVIGSRLRLSIDARKGKETDDAATGHIIALLTELAGSSEVGLEVPRGADVQALDGTSITGTPTGKIAKVLASIFRTLVGTTPWRVTVDSEDPNLSVVITRNGHAVASAVIDAKTLGLADAPVVGKNADNKAEEADKKEKEIGVDLHRFVAAAIVVELAKHHVGFEGLCGATDWRSLGLHYVATTQVGEPLDKSLLAQAVDSDSNNLMSQVALRHALYRRSVDVTKLSEYINWLVAIDEELDGRHRAQLRRRVRQTRLAAAINVLYADSNAATSTPQVDNAALEAAKALAEYYEKVGLIPRKTTFPRLAVRRAGSADLDRQAFPAAAAMLLWVDRALTKGHIAVPAKAAAAAARKDTWRQDLAIKRLKAVIELPMQTLLAEYQIACYQATDATDATSAVRRLEIASTSQALKDWIGKDPQLVKFATSDEYKARFGLRPPRTDFLELDRVAPLAKQLRDLNVKSASDMLRFEGDAKGLAEILKVDVHRATQLLNLANLAKPSKLITGYEVEIAGVLLSLGAADSVERAVAVDATEIEAELRRHIAQGGAKALPTKKTIDHWRRHIKRAPKANPRCIRCWALTCAVRRT